MTALPDLDPGARSAIWGVTGSGKSHLARQLAEQWSATRAVITIDPTAAGPPRIPATRPRLITISPPSPDACTHALLTAYLLSSVDQPVTVICDEAPYYMSRPSDAVLKTIYQGRHRGLGVVLVGQRPSAVAPAVRSQVTQTIFLRLCDRADLNLVAASSRELAAELPTLGVGQWRQWPD